MKSITYPNKHFYLFMAITLVLGSSFAVAQEAVDTSASTQQESLAEQTPAEPAPESPAENASGEHAPTVYIVPLGGEMNLKVRYDHPMDFEGKNYIESVQMETKDKQFLGLKTFHKNHKEAFAEFMVNPKLAKFSEVVFIAKSTTLGEIVSEAKLEFTPEDKLPDDINPKNIAARRLARLQELRDAGKIPEASKEKKVVKKSKETTKEIKNVSKEEAKTVSEPEKQETPKKKKWGLW